MSPGPSNRDLKRLYNSGENALNNRIAKGIALILFGILLCVAGADINKTLLTGFSDFPFSLVGIISGIAGLVMIFAKNKDEKDK